MRNVKMMFVGVGLFISSAAYANYEVEKLMDSYNVAKAEASQGQMSDDEIKKAPFTIQVASYLNEKDAAEHVAELKKREKEVTYVPTFVRGQVWFKVCVGKFEGKDKADDYRKSFIKRMDEPFAVVVSLLDRPGQNARVPANVVMRPITKVPVKSKEVAADEATTKTILPEVKLVPKSGVARIKHEASVVHYQKTAFVKKEKNDGEEYYSVQIGAYPTEELAKENISSTTASHEKFYKIAYVNGKKWYRVFLGKFKNKSEAEAYHHELSADAKTTGAFIRRVTASE